MSRRTQPINIYSIAEEAGVSASTVSRVMNRRVGVGEKTRKKVNDLLIRYNFTPDYPTVRTLKIAVLVPYANLTEYYRKALKGIFEYAQKNSIIATIIIANMPRKESLLELIRDQQCSGVIALMSSAYRQELCTLDKNDLPLVIVDSMIENDNIGFITCDEYTGAVEAIKYLLELGHTQIGFLRYHGTCVNHLLRFKAYENTMKAMGLPIKESWIVTPDKNSEIIGMDGIINMNTLLDQAPEITAVIAVDDTMGISAMTAIHERKLRIPEDISVIGFDNQPQTVTCYPSLTTINHPIEEEAAAAIEAVHNCLKKPGTWIAPKEVFPTSLIIRNSTGPSKTRRN